MEGERAAQAAEPLPRGQTSAPTKEGANDSVSRSARDGHALSKAEETRASQKHELKRWRDNFTQEYGRPPGKEDIARDEKIGG
eukprot:2768252-Pyramimonas_sp.AAC.1